jgi:hypothetical protein
MNIYSQAVRRLSCFKELTSSICYEDGSSDFDTDSENQGYFYGDATAYELYLENMISNA